MNQVPLTSSAGTRKGDMLYRTLGRTGERVSAIGMGGFHIARLLCKKLQRRYIRN